MKRFIAVLLIAVLLVGCGKQAPTTEAEPGTAPSTAATEPTTLPAIEETEPPTEATEPEPTEPPVIRHPLTGEVLDTPYTGHATAVVVNNIIDCQPQHGISDADIFYEVETEGGITRNLAIFTDLENADKIGPIRSARTYFNALARSYQAPLVHCSAGLPARDGYVDNYVTKLSNWEHVDAGAFGTAYFYRDSQRLAQGFAQEHTLFSTGEKLLNVLAYKEYDKVNENGLDFGLQFAEAPVMAGDAATKVKVTFMGSKTTSFAYDAETGLYTASQYGGTHKDGNTGEAVTYRNVMALYVNHTKADVYYAYRSFYDLVGSGEGHMACDGKIIPIKWSHASYEDPFVYTLEDGTPLQLGVGRTYIGITGASDPISYK